jgi:CRISPR-associated protein (TIGR03985 family)
MARINLSTPDRGLLLWLSAGRLAHRWQRTIRLWFLLNRFYGEIPNWSDTLADGFTYPQLRDLLFTEQHPTGDRLTVREIIKSCDNPQCICHQSVWDLVKNSLPLGEQEKWQRDIRLLTAWKIGQWRQELKKLPFATVHRTIRNDCQYLVSLNLLRCEDHQYFLLPASELVNYYAVPESLDHPIDGLSAEESWQFYYLLEAIVFLQPSLEVVANKLWQQLINHHYQDINLGSNSQRIFLHFDYILSDADQDRVDDYQVVLEELWRSPDHGVIQFKYWVAGLGRLVKLTVYPVCLHYAQRAKYLSAYGLDPFGEFGWHNYRLDRIAGKNIKVLAWGNKNILADLQILHDQNQLPTVADVERMLGEAWGLQFYQPRDLLIMRFEVDFARWYVADTHRHDTFQPIAYDKLPRLLREHLGNSGDLTKIKAILAERSPGDVYYWGWIRRDDINIVMRMRAWRSNGEVIAPLDLRERLQREARRELDFYR